MQNILDISLTARTMSRQPPSVNLVDPIPQFLDRILTSQGVLLPWLYMKYSFHLKKKPTFSEDPPLIHSANFWCGTCMRSHINP